MACPKCRDKSSICTNPELKFAVETLLKQGVPLREIQERIPNAKRSTLSHYRRKHYPTEDELQEQEREKEKRAARRQPKATLAMRSTLGQRTSDVRSVPPDLSDPSSLLAFVRDLAVRTNGVLADAERSGHRSAAVAAARESRAFAQLLLELEGAYGKYARPSGDIEAAKAQAVIAECLSELTPAEKREWLHGLTCPDCIRWQQEQTQNGLT